MLEPGEQIDIWVVEAALGSGGMGSVYRCHNRSATRIKAAVKVLESSLRRHPEAEARFIREAEILFQLDHPNIVKVRNIRTEGDPPYLEMEFVAGESLEERLRKGALPFEVARPLMEQCASAIHYLHGKGVRHRDIKPANLLINDDGDVKLVDFGLAMEADTSRLTQQGMAFGTVSYAPPEWIAPDTLDPARWDIYAMGVVFYELLTGQVAFPVSGQGSARQQAMQVIVGKQNHEPLDPGETFHDDLRELIGHMTQPRAEKRMSTAAELHRRMQSVHRQLRREPGVTLMPTTFADDEVSVVSDPPQLPAPVPQPADDPNVGDTWEGQDAPLPVAPTPTGSNTRRAGGLVALLSVGAIGIGGVIALGVVVLTAVVWMSGTSTRGLRIAVTSSSDLPVSLALGDREPDSFVADEARFDGVELGQVQIAWAVGPTCLAPCDTGCPAWCGTGFETLQLTAGDGDHTHSLALPDEPTHTVALALPELAAETALQATLAGTTGTRGEAGVTFGGVSPGQHTLQLVAGECSDDQLDCWPAGECPAGCSAHQEQVTVSWVDGAVLSVALPQPSEAAAPQPDPKQVRPQPTQQPAPVSPEPTEAGVAQSRSRVTNAQFSSWLQSRPEFAIGGSNASADANYLRGWVGSTPPPVASPSGPVHYLTWNTATAYCGGPAKVASVHAEPQQFPEGSVPMEWRYDDAIPGAMLLMGDGSHVPVGSTDKARRAALRCAK